MDEEFADGMIRNSRSDGPGDRGPYGMGDCDFVTRGLQSSLRTGAWKRNAVGRAGEGDICF